MLLCRARCRRTFRALEKALPSRSRASILDSERPNCRCEKASVSPHSPGRIEESEILVRILVAPQHIRPKTGRPRAAALSDAETHGLSLIRERTATDEEIRATAEMLVARARQANGDKAGVFGVLRMTCSTVRGFRYAQEIEQCYCIYDTALPEQRSHAESFQRVAGAEDGISAQRRERLFDQLQETFVPVQDFRDGLLSDLAPGV
jgi:hypothetical protein